MMVRAVVLAAVVVITTATPAGAAQAWRSAGGTGPAASAAPAEAAAGEAGSIEAAAREGRPARAAGGAGSIGPAAEAAASQAEDEESAASGPSDAKCDAGSFCAWSGPNYTGKVARLNLETANPNQCVTLPGNLVAKSLANLMTRDVSVYEGATCSTEAEFTTYPKGGTYVPNAPFVVRAIQVW